MLYDLVVRVYQGFSIDIDKRSTLSKQREVRHTHEQSPFRLAFATRSLFPCFTHSLTEFCRLQIALHVLYRLPFK